MRSVFAVFAVLLLLGGCAPSVSQIAQPQVSARAEAPYFVQPERMAEKRQQVHERPVDVVFIGDSVTQNYEKTSADRSENYRPVWDAYFAKRNAVNLGYGMDTTGATLWRFGQGELDGIDPKAAVILIGTNDTNLGRGPIETLSGIEAVVSEVQTRMPSAKVLLLGILPSGKSAQKSRFDAQVNQGLAARYGHDGRVAFIDVSAVFMKGGILDRSLFVEQPPQGALHPNARGQALMAHEVDLYLARVLGEHGNNGR